MLKRVFIAATVLCATAILSACATSGQESASANNRNAPAAANSSNTSSQSNNTPTVTSSHGEKTTTATAPNSNASKSSFDTEELDEKIKKADEKAKASGASAADKKAAAEAYLERANVYYEAGQPRLYKFALRDFKRVLSYQPDNEEAKEKSEMIVSIYKQMGRPVPEVGDDEKP